MIRGLRGAFDSRAKLGTWIYRIALHEAANRRRWWFRHKAQETSIEPEDSSESEFPVTGPLVDRAESPFENRAHSEVRIAVGLALREVPEPYRTALVLRDLEEMSYEDIAEVLQISLGTVKSRITRGRNALRQRLAGYVREVGSELGLRSPESTPAASQLQGSRGGREIEVTP